VRRGSLRTGAAGLLAVLLPGCSAASNPPAPSSPAPTHTLTGQLVVADLTLGIPTCDPTRAFGDSFSDLQGGTQLPCPKALPSPYAGAAPGAPVTVTSSTGETLGTGRLENGVLSIHGVRYPFTVTGLGPSASYTVKVSTVTSGKYSRAALDRADWVVELTVGHKAL